MAGLDNNVLFYLKGDSLADSSFNNIGITPTGMTEAQIEDEQIGDTLIKCINFNTTGCLKFNLDSSFFDKPWTLDWWEKDTNLTAKLSSIFTNIIASSGGASFGVLSNGANQRNITNMSANGSAYITQNMKFGDDIQGEWVHRAVVFTGNEYKYYQNGTLYHTFAGASCYKRDAFQMGRWRTSAVALDKKVYNFRLSNTIRYTEDFTPSPDEYTEEEFDGITIDPLAPLASLNDILIKVKEIKEANVKLQTELANILNMKGIDANASEKLQILINKVKQIG